VAREKKATPKKLCAGLLSKVLIVTLLAAAALQLFHLQEQLDGAQASRDALEAQVEATRQRNDALKGDIAEGCTPEKIQEIARRELGWVLPGEYVFGN
jgi:cell division protein FtsB